MALNLNNTRLILFIVLAIFALVAIPAVWLGFYNHPYVEDDYCFAYMTRDYGLWEAIKIYYNGWSGRFFSNSIFQATPLAYGNFWFVKIMPILMLTLLVHSSYFFFKANLFEGNKTKSITLSLAFVSTYLLFSDRIFETLYWYTSVFIFPLSLCMFLYMMAFKKSKPYLVFQFVLSICIVGTNELMMFLTIGLLVLFLLYQTYTNKRLDPWLLVLLCTTVAIGYFVVIKAPGNAIRMHNLGILDTFELKQIRDAWFSFIRSFPKWAFLALPLLILTKKLDPKINFTLNAGLGLLLLVCITIAMFFTIHFGNNMGVPPRVNSQIFALVLIGLIVFMASINLDILDQKWLFMALLLFGMSSLFYSKNLKDIYRDLIKGHAKKYHVEMQARYATLGISTNDTVYLKPLTYMPQTLTGIDIGNNTKHLWNVCYAKYFKKEAVVMAP